MSRHGQIRTLARAATKLSWTPKQIEMHNRIKALMRGVDDTRIQKFAKLLQSVESEKRTDSRDKFLRESAHDHFGPTADTVIEKVVTGEITSADLLDALDRFVQLNPSQRTKKKADVKREKRKAADSADAKQPKSDKDWPAEWDTSSWTDEEQGRDCYAILDQIVRQLDTRQYYALIEALATYNTMKQQQIASKVDVAVADVLSDPRCYRTGG